MAGELLVYLLEFVHCLHSFDSPTSSGLHSVLVRGTLGIAWTARFILLSPKKRKIEENSG